MSDFAKSTRQKLRFESDRGYLTTEDLWDLPLTKLNTLAKTLNKQLKATDEEDFLGEHTEEDAETRLKFGVVLAVLETKKQERDERQTAATRKAEREKIAGILAEKKEDALKNLSVEALEARLQALS